MPRLPLLHSCQNLSLDVALPCFMAQHNCEDLIPADTPSTVPAFAKAYSGHALNPICAHSPSSSQVSHDKSSNSMVPQCPNSAEHLLNESAGDTSKEDYPVV